MNAVREDLRATVPRVFWTIQGKPPYDINQCCAIDAVLYVVLSPYSTLYLIKSRGTSVGVTLWHDQQLK